MNTYAIELWGHTSTQIGKTAGAAKYNMWLESESGMDFIDYIRNISSCRLVHKFRPSDLFGDVEQFCRVITSRGIDFAFMGMKVEVAGKPGVIVGANSSCNLDVCFDGECYGANCHPWHETIYYDNQGKIIADYRKKVAGK